MEKNQIRAYILLRCKLGIEPKVIHQELIFVMGDSAPSIRTIYRWIERFSTGSESLEDEHRSGRPITAFTSQNIQLVKDLIEEDPHISYSRLEAYTSLNRNTLVKIIHEALNLSKRASRWIPHKLTDEQKLKRLTACQRNLDLVNSGKLRLCDIITGDESWIYHRKIEKRAMNSSWVAEGETPRTVVKRDRFEPKSMFAIFFKSTGALVVRCVNKGETVDNEFYIENCLTPLVKKLTKLRKKSGVTNMKLLHDNARPHVHKNVRNFLENQGIGLVEHPPYSPDLAPCDFWLFDYIKRELDDHESAESLEKQITKIVKSIPKKEYQKTFEKWVERMQFCVDIEGDYFEHIIN